MQCEQDSDSGFVLVTLLFPEFLGAHKLEPSETFEGDIPHVCFLPCVAAQNNDRFAFLPDPLKEFVNMAYGDDIIAIVAEIVGKPQRNVGLSRIDNIFGNAVPVVFQKFFPYPVGHVMKPVAFMFHRGTSLSDMV
jgi:hypothetical protein